MTSKIYVCLYLKYVSVYVHFMTKILMNPIVEVVLLNILEPFLYTNIPLLIIFIISIQCS